MDPLPKLLWGEAMKLSVIERIALVNILPKEGNVKTLRMLRTLKEDLAFSDQENKDLNVRQEGDLIKWDVAMERPKEVHIGETMTDLIKTSMEKLSNEGKLPEVYLDLYDRFFTN